MRRPLRVICSLLSALAPGPALGQPLAPDAPGPDPSTVNVTISNDLEIRYWISDARLPDPPDVPVFNYVEQVNRLNARAALERWSFAAQVDEVALLANRYFLDDVLQTERRLLDPAVPNVFGADTDAYVNLEKVKLAFEERWGVVALGDAYAAFGRGVALNLNRNVDIDIDTSIQGAKAVLRPGAWDITLVAGQLNRQQVFQDNPNLDLYGDLRHSLGGVRLERFGLGPANLGAHGVVYDFVDTPGIGAGLSELSSPVDVLVGGATAELIGVGGIDWFIEGDLFRFGEDHPSPLGPDASPLGHALYLSSAFYPGPLVFLVEAKRYQQAERINAVLAPELYEVAIAPTLEYERVITEDSSAAINSNDVWGGRVQVDWGAIPGELAPSLALAVFRDLELGGLHFNAQPETIIHPVATVEWIKGDLGLLANAGHRWDLRDSDGGADRQLHSDVSFNFPLGHELIGYMSLQGEWFRWGINELQQEDYVETETGWTISYGSKAG
ncbi:MAG TPA: hypothetical protein ENK18_07345, partial [Deltaproteobacteria bacterium]|nr:hypothetical protein [Deltaproteobacteria bacterium]